MDQINKRKRVSEKNKENKQHNPRPKQRIEYIPDYPSIVLD
jgi:hypothetical protein